MRLPLVTVCIVVFNGQDYIIDAVESILNQTYPKLEVVIVDGGSTDGTLQLLNNYQDRIATLVSEPDAGIYDAMNKACRLAGGDWLIFLGCDDVLLDSFSTIARMLEDSKTVYYGNVILKTTRRVYGGRFTKYRLMQSNICHQALFYPKEVYQADSYSLKYRFLADYDYNIRLIGRGINFRFLNVNVALYNDVGLSMGGDSEFERDKHQIIRKNFGPLWALIKSFRTMAVSAIKTYFPGRPRGPR